MPDNPFDFLVIDDPVQAMDPAKVDGLVKVLSEVAKERQITVFTHDNRLAALTAVSRLGGPHRRCPGFPPSMLLLQRPP